MEPDADKDEVEFDEDDDLMMSGPPSKAKVSSYQMMY